LMFELQKSHQLAYLLILYDLTLVPRIADIIAVMAGGKIVDYGPAQRIIADAKQAETQMLLASARTAQANLNAILGTAP